MEDKDFSSKLKVTISKVAKKILFSIIFRVVIIVLIACMLIGAFSYLLGWIDGVLNQEDSGNVPGQAAKYRSQVIINDDRTISSGITAKEFWESLKENGSNVEAYLSGPEALAKLINAELITQFPDIRENVNNPIDWDGIDLESGKLQGIVKFRRESENANSGYMTYIDSDTFYEWVEEYNNTDDNSALRNKIMSHFTISEQATLTDNETTNYTSATYDINNPNLTQGEKIVAYADKFVGNPYVWGGNSLTNGIDCSHFVWRVLQNTIGYKESYTTSTNWARRGKAVSSLSQAIAGDIIVYKGHVAIYDGKGYLVEAKGKQYGITHDRKATSNKIIAIRRFTDGAVSNGSETKNSDNGSTNSDEETELGKTTYTNKKYVVEVANWNRKTIERIKEPGDERTTTVDANIGIETIDYQQLLTSQYYNLPFNLLWAFLVTGEQEEFVLAWADLVYNSEIEITVYDNYQTSVDWETKTYKEGTPEQYVISKVTTIETITLDTALTKANTWIVNYSKKFEAVPYSNSADYTLTDSNATNRLTAAADEVARYLVKNNYTYKNTGYVNYTFPIQNTPSRKTLSCSSYIQQVLYTAGYTQYKGREKLYATTNKERALKYLTDQGISAKLITNLSELQPGDIVQTGTSYHVFMAYSIKGNKVVTKGVPEVLNSNGGFAGRTRTLSYLNSRKCYAIRLTDVEKENNASNSNGDSNSKTNYSYSTTNNNTYVAGEATIKEKDNFCKLYNKPEYRQNRLNIDSCSSWLFEIIETNADTANYLDLIKYLLYKATGYDYGVTSYDFNAIDTGSLSSISELKGNSNEEKIWRALIKAGYSKYAVAGVLGNIYVESGFKSNNVQNSYESRVGSDTVYTAKVNNGSYTETQFSTDSAGYGLCQWTSSGRKKGLYKYAKSKGVGIDNLQMQIEYLIGEVTRGGGAKGYASFQMGMTNRGYNYNSWKNANSVDEATAAFCYVFERPGSPNISVRKNKAKELYNKFKDLQ